LAAMVATAAVAVLPAGCGGGSHAPDVGFDPHDPVAVARAYVRMNLSCRNPGYDFVYDPTFSGPLYLQPSDIVACHPVPAGDIDASLVRYAGRYALVATRINGAPAGSLWLVRTERGYLIGTPPGE
jgi:hypothetical protein